MKAGFAKTCITPPIGMPMEGLGQTQVCNTIHDDLFVRALFLEQEEERILIVSFDLLFFERSDVDRFKGAIGRSLDMTPAQIFLNTTHTHAGPRVTRWAYGGTPDAAYFDQLEEAVLEAAEEARKALRTVRVWAGETRTKLPVSRRKPGAEGKVRWFPHWEGTVCDALPFCVLKDEEDKVVSVLFSVACHPSMIYLPVISAEYPGVAMKELNRHFWTEGSIFLQGAAGDTKPRHVASESVGWREGTWEEMEAAGREVAEAVIQGTGGRFVEIQPDLRVCFTEIRWPLEAAPSRKQLEAIRDNDGERQQRRTWAEDMLLRLNRRGRLDSHVLLSVHFLQLGKGLRLIGVEGEVLAKLGLKMLEVYNEGITFALGYTNGARIYMPVTEELPEGGYEVDSFWEYHLPSPSLAGCESALLEALKDIRDSGKILNESYHT